MPDDLSETIADSAQNPRSATVDGVTAEQQPLPDQVKADQYLAGKEAVHKTPTASFVRVRMAPPGAV